MCESFKLINIIRKLRYLLLSIAILLIVCPVLFIFPFSVHAQEADDIIINKIDFDSYPGIEIYINFKEDSELEYLDLGEEDFLVLENGETVTNLSVKGMDEIPDPIGVVLVLDASGSMRGEPIADALNSASFFLSEMRSMDKVAVVSFADNVTVHSDFTTDREQLRDSISEIEVHGETSLFDGIYAASELFRSAGDIKHKYLIVLSDGGDTASRHTRDEVIKKALQEKISIYSIALITPEFDPEAIEDISESTGGEILSTVDSKELQGLYKSISKRIIGQYRISYTSLWPAAEDIEISVNVKKMELSGSTAVTYENPYYSPAPRTLAIDPGNYFFITLFDTPWARPALLALIFVSVTLLLYSFVLFMPARRKTLKEKAKSYGFKTEGGGTGEEEGESEEERKGFTGWIISVVSRIASRRGFIEFFDLKLDRAGMKIRASEFITLHVTGALIITLLVHYFGRNIILTILVILIAVISPFLFLNIKTAKRLKNFHAQLPDALQLISGSLKAGYSFSQAMSMVVEESKPPIS
jgi:tight adherence protein B